MKETLTRKDVVSTKPARYCHHVWEEILIENGLIKFRITSKCLCCGKIKKISDFK